MNQFLSDAERILASPEPGSTVLERLARAAVPTIADFCFVFLVDGSEVRCIACAHATPGGERLLRGLNCVYRITRNDPLSTVAHVVRTGRARLIAEIRSEPLGPAASFRVLTLHRRLGARSALVVPIGRAPRVRGAISLSYAESGRHYAARDVPAAQRLGNMAAAFLRRTAMPVQGRPRPPLLARRAVRLRARA